MNEETPPPLRAPPESEPLSEYFERNVDAVTEMHLQSERVLSIHQRAIEYCTARLGRPSSLYFIIVLAVLWAAGNAVVPLFGLTAPDPAPFFWLQGVVGLLALLTTTMVLTTQLRQAKLLERRMHLDLQVNLVTEQKAAKIIELLEELRRDLPNVHDRTDSEAESMQRSAEPLRIMAALEERQTVEAVREALAADDGVVAAAGLKTAQQSALEEGE